jgi:hypothetical protein
MLDMGFIHDIRKILAFLPKQRQNLLFSATFSNEIRQLAKGIVHNPVEMSVSPRNTTAETVKQWICPVDKKKKAPLLTIRLGVSASFVDLFLRHQKQRQTLEVSFYHSPLPFSLLPESLSLNLLKYH